MKVTDEQLLGALEQTGGLFQDTADLILKLYKIKITRQAVGQRIAAKHPKLLNEIRAASVMHAEDSVRDLSVNSNDARVRGQNAQYLLDRIGKELGYTPRHEFSGNIDATITGKVVAYLPDNGRGKPELPGDAASD